MPFFRPLPPPIDSPVEYQPAIWTGPSEYEFAKIVPLGELVMRSDAVVCRLDFARPYRNGIELSFLVVCKEQLQTSVFKQGLAPLNQAFAGGLRIGYESSDGRVAGEVPTLLGDIPVDEFGIPYISVLFFTLAGVSSRRFEIRAFCWPLPPPGPMTIYFEWLDQGVPESAKTFDAAAVLAHVPAVVDAW